MAGKHKGERNTQARLETATAALLLITALVGPVVDRIFAPDPTTVVVINNGPTQGPSP